jgi:membrane protein implicated in regulation of membrane protease activity
VEKAFSNFNGLEYFFLICAAIGGFFVLLRLVLQFVGGGIQDAVDTDVDFDSHHADSDAGFKFLSIHGLTSFLMMFGLVGLALYRQSRVGFAVAILGAILAGLAAVWVIGQAFQWATRLQTSGNLQTSEAVGSTGTVYLHIPEKGTGRVSINFRNHLREFDAVAGNGAALPTGTAVRVVQVRGNVLVVEGIN